MTNSVPKSTGGSTKKAGHASSVRLFGNRGERDSGAARQQPASHFLGERGDTWFESNGVSSEGA
jgi:hypothetical protein